MAFVLRVTIHTTIVIVLLVWILLLFVFVRVVVRGSIIVWILLLRFILVKQTTLVSLIRVIRPFGEQDHIIEGGWSVHKHLPSNVWLKAM